MIKSTPFPATPPSLAAFTETRASIGFKQRPPMAVFHLNLKAAKHQTPPSKTANDGLYLQQLFMRYLVKTAKHVKGEASHEILRFFLDIAPCASEERGKPVVREFLTSSFLYDIGASLLCD